MHQPAVAEAHLVLGRMHVDVHPRRVEFEEQHVGRLAAVEQHVAVGQLHRVGDVAVAHAAAVDVDVLLVGAGPGIRRLGDPAVQPQAGAFVVHAQRLAGEILAQGFAQAQVGHQVAGLVAARGLAVVRDAQFHVGPGQRQRAQPLLDVAQFGAFGAQELAPRRHVVEQLAHLDRGPRRQGLRRDLAHPAAVHLQHRAVRIAGPARSQREPADRGDRGQRLAAEAERGHGFQVVERGDLAGGVARHRQRQLVRGDAAAVVADADQAHAAFLQIDVDAAGAGVERVLDQLLDHRRRAFDDLAGGDLVDQGVGKLADRHGIGRGCAIGKRSTIIADRSKAARSGPTAAQGLPPPVRPPDAATASACARAAYSVPGGGWRVK